MYCKNNFKNRNDIQSLKDTAALINSINFKNLDDSGIRSKTKKLMIDAEHRENDNLLIEAFALVKEVIERVLGIVPYDEQLMAGVAMHKGNLIEMYTGEGKTVAAVFPAYLNVLYGRKVHILTFNDYLARRDANWMGTIFHMLGLSVGCVQADMDRQLRKEAYGKNITYGTAREVGFDYLRNCLCFTKEDLIEIPMDYAIVDEADSILIDEARIPLVVAEREIAVCERMEKALHIIRGFIEGIDYTADECKKLVYFTERGIEKIEGKLMCDNLYTRENLELLTELNNLLYAETLLKKDIDYIVRNNNIEMVDEFTGRVAVKRQWPEGLQAAIEIKEGLKDSSRGRVISQITLQSFICLYKKFTGMTGTANDSYDEFKEFYDLDVLAIPPHKECIRIDYPDAIFTNRRAKYAAIIEEVSRVHKTGQPVLIGTGNISESIEVGNELKKAGIECRILNAKNDELEAQIVEEAGEFGAITVSTNMAGRGTDIKLGGVNEKNRDKVAALGGLYVIGCSRHGSNRIDRQLIGRAGRQGDPGMSRFFISFDDNLLKKYDIENMLAKKYKNISKDTPVDQKKVKNKIRHIQRIIEGQNKELRRTLWKYSLIVEAQRKQIYKRRLEILSDLLPLNLLERKIPELYQSIFKSLGKENTMSLEKRIALYYMDECWSEHLNRLEHIRDGLHLNVIGGKDPLAVFVEQAIRFFEELEEEVQLKILHEFESLDYTKDGVKTIEDKLKPPTSTCTYLVLDNSFEESLGLMFIKNRNSAFAAVGLILMWPFILSGLLYEKFIKRRFKRI